MRANHEQTASKVARHRERMRAAGLRPVQFWVPDTRTLQFVVKVQGQCQSLKGDRAEAEVLHFTQEAATYIDGWK